MKLDDYISQQKLNALIKAALAEDLGEAGDITSKAVIPVNAHLKTRVTARQDYTLAGVAVAEQVFLHMPGNLKVILNRDDGENVQAGDAVMEVHGLARDILTAERTALNFLQRLTGIATLTRAYVKHVQKYGTQILDTRKTTPTLRALEKFAVACGGGTNHRMGLYDRIMMKDNHLACRYETGAINFRELVEACRKDHPDVLVEIEVDTVAQFEEVVKAKPDWILLDNMTTEQMKECVDLNAGSAKLEASGNVNLDTVEWIASTGVDAISVGAITHSVRAADIALDVIV